jgi:ribosomal protein L32
LRPVDKSKKSDQKQAVKATPTRQAQKNARSRRQPQKKIPCQTALFSCNIFWLSYTFMAVPKKKPAKSYSKTRYTHYAKAQQKKILERTHVVYDKETGEARLSHCINKDTGRYKGRLVIDKGTGDQSNETTRIQA